MKVSRKALWCALFAMMAVFLAGCQPAASKTAAEPTDVDQMESATKETLLDHDREEKSYYVLVVGNDSRLGTPGIAHPDYADGSGRSDTMMLVRVDPVAYRVAIITIPRDTATPYNGGTTKLNETYRVGGIDQLSLEVEKLTGVCPKYYLDLGFVTFEDFVNALGGVEADVPLPMQMSDIVTGESITLEAGPQHLDGAEALVLARTRNLYADDLDACRQTQDRQIVEAAIRKVAADPVNAALHAEALIGQASSNFPLEELASTVADFAEHADQLSIVSGTGPYSGGIDEATQLWLAPRDEATWRTLIEHVEGGGSPQDIVPLPEVRQG